MKRRKTPSLKSSLRRVSVKWALIGLFLSLLTGFGCLLYSSRLAAESEAKILAESLSRAFRPQILQGDVRDAQFQMNFVLGNARARSVRVLSVDRNEIYPIPDDKSVSCNNPGEPCWQGLTHLTYLQPIYFDDDRKQGLYGYLSLAMKPQISWPLVIAFGGFILLLFGIHAFGLLSALSDISKNILEPLSLWATHISGNPNNPAPTAERLKFKEFQKMEDAVSGLHLTIAKLEEESAVRAKEKAKFTIVREIGHDLKTPLSQVSKHFHLLRNEISESKSLGQSRIESIEKALSRMGDLIRQIKRVEPQATGHSEVTDLVQTASEFISSSRELDVEVNRKGIQLSFESTLNFAPVRIERIKLYQMIDNLVRNAIDAISDTGGKIIVNCFESGDSLILSVADTGLGIPSELQDKIFERDFTTKANDGTGLGLAIVSRICEECGATIHLESKDGVGSEFLIEFPKMLLGVSQNEKMGLYEVQNIDR